MTVHIPKEWDKKVIEQFVKECESKGGKAIITTKANAIDFATNTETDLELDKGFAVLTCNVNGKDIENVLLFNVPPEIYEKLKQSKSMNADELLK